MPMNLAFFFFLLYSSCASVQEGVEGVLKIENGGERREWCLRREKKTGKLESEKPHSWSNVLIRIMKWFLYYLLCGMYENLHTSFILVQTNYTLLSPQAKYHKWLPNLNFHRHQRITSTLKPSSESPFKLWAPRRPLFPRMSSNF